MQSKNCHSAAAVEAFLALEVLKIADWLRTGFDLEGLAFIVDWVANRVVAVVM
jgi:hypothetical protein